MQNYATFEKIYYSSIKEQLQICRGEVERKLVLLTMSVLVLV